MAEQVRAEMVANVMEVVATVGTEVAEGDTIVLLESMKMEIPVESEDDGTVSEIRCEEGKAVSEGDVLIVLE